MPDLRQQPAFGLFAVAEPESYGNVTRSPQVLPSKAAYKPPHNGTPTSHAAAIKVGCKTDTQRGRIAVYMLGRADGATRNEIADALGMDENSVRPRVYELLGLNQSYLDRGGEAVLVETGETREYNGHGPAKVLKHKLALT